MRCLEALSALEDALNPSTVLVGKTDSSIPGFGKDLRQVLGESEGSQEQLAGLECISSAWTRATVTGPRDYLGLKISSMRNLTGMLMAWTMRDRLVSHNR